MNAHPRFEKTDWSRVPSHLRVELERWVINGTPPQRSRFLRSVLVNDLAGAVRTCVGIECLNLVHLTQFLIDECPADSFGSLNNVHYWGEMGGLTGVVRITEKRGAIYGR
jgi:hypothetical protein